MTPVTSLIIEIQGRILVMQLSTATYRPTADGTPHQHLLHVIGYFVPIILTMVGFAVPFMRYRIVDTFAITQTEQLYLAIFVIVEILIAAIWIIVDLAIITDDRTTGRQLKQNVLVGSLLNDAMMIALGSTLLSGDLPWFLLIPALASSIDDKIVGRRALSNALQKPITQIGPTP